MGPGTNEETWYCQRWTWPAAARVCSRSAGLAMAFRQCTFCGAGEQAPQARIHRLSPRYTSSSSQRAERDRLPGSHPQEACGRVQSPGSAGQVKAGSF